MTTLTDVDPRSAFRLCHRSMEFRAVGNPEGGDGRTLEGYAAVFDQPTTIESYAGDFEETVQRGAFRKTLRERQPVMQFDHGNDKRTGSVPIGAIEDLREDDEGLFVRADLFDNDVVEPIRQAVAGKAIRGMSFKFRVLRDRWVDRDGKKIRDDELADLLADPGDRGPVRREILEVELFELGPVVFPAYDQTSVGVRSLPAGSRFNPTALAVRGVLAQFGLTERCVKRHLQTFDDQERAALALEIDKTFPELRQLLNRDDAAAPDDTAAEPPSEPSGEDADQASSDAAGDSTSDTPDAAVSSTSGRKAGPATGHPAFLGEAPSWRLPDPNERGNDDAY